MEQEMAMWSEHLKAREKALGAVSVSALKSERRWEKRWAERSERTRELLTELKLESASGPHWANWSVQQLEWMSGLGTVTRLGEQSAPMLALVLGSALVAPWAEK